MEEVFLNPKMNKVIVGLALINDFFNGRLNQTLLNLYSNSNITEIKALHERYIDSVNHFDREVAFWLELVLEKIPLKINFQDLIVEIFTINTHSAI